ncbi:MAG: polysaccharide biosynthesis protein [Bacteroidales bacterium]|nr:polysaccharide biosynthesis protein [Bacteroidales bacterium]
MTISDVFKLYRLRRNTPRWIVFFIDVSIVLISLYLSYLIRFNFKIPKLELQLFLKYSLPIILFTRIILFIIFKLYSGIIRYTSIEDLWRTLKIIALGSLIFIIVNLFTYTLYNLFVIPFSIIILEFIVTYFLIFFIRLFIKLIFREIALRNKIFSNIAIVGTSNFAISVKRSLDNDFSILYNTKAFIDYKGHKKGLRLEGIKIWNLEDYEKHIKEIDSIILAEEHLPKSVKKKISEKAIEHNIRVYEVPTIKEWIGGELHLSQLKKIKLEDLLERDVIQINKENIAKQLFQKKILITGAAGSIGQELVRQIIKYKPELIILYDQSETALYELTLELEEVHNFIDYKYILGDITNQQRIEYVIKRYKPEIIYHAAAYKHVPVLEINASEAILVNVYGTKLLADLANKYNVEKFIMISTDKAIKPSGIMGATKRIAEMYCQSLGTISNTKYITTRFGNVLGSNGSVVERFRKQIEKGGPVTVTHPDVTRYFMTIPEACNLVLEASAMGKQNEIFIFDMGNPIKIVDLARKMIRLAGFIENIDIKIVYTGLRPGEKLYEELISDYEDTLKTYNPQIMISKVKPIEYTQLNNQIEHLINISHTFDNHQIIKEIQKMLPDFKPANPRYFLDNSTI